MNETNKLVVGREKPMINSKFWPLADYLKAQNMSRTILTFEEIESILGFPLCKSAQIYKAYWHPSTTHTLPNVCLEAGYEITDIDLKSKKVCFEK